MGGEFMHMCVSRLALPVELKHELLGDSPGDYIIKIALYRANSAYREPEDTDLRDAWQRVKPYAAAWYAQHRPGEQMPDEPWRDKGEMN